MHAAVPWAVAYPRLAGLAEAAGQLDRRSTAPIPPAAQLLSTQRASIVTGEAACAAAARAPWAWLVLRLVLAQHCERLANEWFGGFGLGMQVSER